MAKKLTVNRQMSKPILVVKCLRYLYSKTKRLAEVKLCCFETNVLLCHNEIHLCLSNLTSSHGMRAVNLKKGDVINSIRQPVCRPKTLFNPRVSGLSILFNYGQICIVLWTIIVLKRCLNRQKTNNDNDHDHDSHHFRTVTARLWRPLYMILN